MSKFNKNALKSVKTVENLAGGEAFALSKKTELATLLLSNFCADQFYRSGNDSIERIKELSREVDPTFAAKAAIFARDKFNMRSTSHVVAAELANNAPGTPNLRRFFDAVVVRPDDMLEIASLASTETRSNGKAKLPRALKAGFKTAFNKFDAYQIAKYRGDKKGWSLVDLVNMVRPVPTETNEEALHLLVTDKLRSTETWESKLSDAGADTEKKSEAWAELLKENKLGYMALLRNLRNILQQAPESKDIACRRLLNKAAIKRSRVLPFRFYTAYKELQSITGASPVLKSLSEACDIALENVPKLERTLVVLDDSASMSSPVASGNTTCLEAGAMFASALIKSNDADLVMFNDHARYTTIDTGMSVLPMTEKIMSKTECNGTDFNCIFPILNKAYDRIIILSDMQGWVGYNTPTKTFAAYKKRHACDPYIYSVDLRGYGTSQFPENKIATLSGFSDKMFDLMVMAEQDKQALVNEIEAVTF
jgi:hypothetical protein